MLGSRLIQLQASFQTTWRLSWPLLAGQPFSVDSSESNGFCVHPACLCALLAPFCSPSSRLSFFAFSVFAFHLCPCLGQQKRLETFQADVSLKKSEHAAASQNCRPRVRIQMSEQGRQAPVTRPKESGAIPAPAESEEDTWGK